MNNPTASELIANAIADALSETFVHALEAASFNKPQPIQPQPQPQPQGK